MNRQYKERAGIATPAHSNRQNIPQDTHTTDAVQVYSWPSRPRCPSCKSLETHRAHTWGAKQTRDCADCGARFVVVGKVA